MQSNREYFYSYLAIHKDNLPYLANTSLIANINEKDDCAILSAIIDRNFVLIEKANAITFEGAASALLSTQINGRFFYLPVKGYKENGVKYITSLYFKNNDRETIEFNLEQPIPVESPISAIPTYLSGTNSLSLDNEEETDVPFESMLKDNDKKEKVTITLTDVGDAKLQAETKKGEKIEVIVEDDDIPEDFKCPISLNLILDPVIRNEQHAYEREKLIEWFEINDNDPLTRETLTEEEKTFKENPTLKAQIQKWAIAKIEKKYQSSFSVDKPSTSGSDYSANPHTSGVSSYSATTVVKTTTVKRYSSNKASTSGSNPPTLFQSSQRTVTVIKKTIQSTERTTSREVNNSTAASSSAPKKFIMPAAFDKLAKGESLKDQDHALEMLKVKFTKLNSHQLSVILCLHAKKENFVKAALLILKKHKTSIYFRALNDPLAAINFLFTARYVKDLTPYQIASIVHTHRDSEKFREAFIRNLFAERVYAVLLKAQTNNSSGFFGNLIKTKEETLVQVTAKRPSTKFLMKMRNENLRLEEKRKEEKQTNKEKGSNEPSTSY